MARRRRRARRPVRRSASPLPWLVALIATAVAIYAWFFRPPPTGRERLVADSPPAPPAAPTPATLPEPAQPTKPPAPEARPVVPVRPAPPPAPPTKLPEAAALRHMALVANALANHAYYDGALTVDLEYGHHAGQRESFRDFNNAKSEALSAGRQQGYLDKSILAGKIKQARRELTRYRETLRTAVALVRRAHERVGLPLAEPSPGEVEQTLADVEKLKTTLEQDRQRYMQGRRPAAYNPHDGNIQTCVRALDFLEAIGREDDVVLRTALWSQAQRAHKSAASGAKFALRQK